MQLERQKRDRQMQFERQKRNVVMQFVRATGHGEALKMSCMSSISLSKVDSEESSKHCIAVGISRRLAGYWEKFSISNHLSSVETSLLQILPLRRANNEEQFF